MHNDVSAVCYDCVVVVGAHAVIDSRKKSESLSERADSNLGSEINDRLLRWCLAKHVPSKLAILDVHEAEMVGFDQRSLSRQVSIEMVAAALSISYVEDEV